MRIKILITALSLAFYSCNLDKTPKCGDPEVVSETIELLKKQIKEKLKEEYIQENFKKYDAIEYAENKGWNVDDYLASEEKRIENESDSYADSALLTTSLKNIRSNSIDKEIKRCNCSAEVENDNLKKIEVTYSGQRTEDKDEAVFVQLSYEVKE